MPLCFHFDDIISGTFQLSQSQRHIQSYDTFCGLYLFCVGCNSIPSEKVFLFNQSAWSTMLTLSFVSAEEPFALVVWTTFSEWCSACIFYLVACIFPVNSSIRIFGIERSSITVFWVTCILATYRITFKLKAIWTY